MQLQVMLAAGAAGGLASGGNLEGLLPLLGRFLLLVLDAALYDEPRRPAGRTELEDPETPAPEVAELFLRSEFVAVAELLHYAVEVRRLVGNPVGEGGRKLTDGLAAHRAVGDDQGHDRLGGRGVHHDSPLPPAITRTAA